MDTDQKLNEIEIWYKAEAAKIDNAALCWDDFVKADEALLNKKNELRLAVLEEWQNSADYSAFKAQQASIRSAKIYA